MYELMYQGSYQLIRYHYKEFKKADYKGAYSVDRRYDEYLNKSLYFIKTPEGKCEKIKLKKKNFLKKFPDLEPKINAFSKKNKVKMDNPSDYVAFFGSLDAQE